MGQVEGRAVGWVECVRDGLCLEAPPAAQLKDGREGSVQGWSGRGQGVCLPGEITAWAEPRVPRVPAQVVQFRAELRGSVSCWSPLRCSSQGASGCGSVMGKRCRQGSPPWVTADDPPVYQQLHRCALVPSPTSHGPGLPRHTAGRRQTRKFASTFLTPPHWGLSHTPDCCFRLRVVGKHVVKTGDLKIGNYLHFAVRET